MKDPVAVGRDATYFLSEMQYRYIQDEIVKIAREKLIARNVLPIATLADWGKTNYTWEADVDMSVARVEMGAQTPNADIAALSPTTIFIPTIHKDFTIKARQLASSKHSPGESLDVRSARLAGEKVAEKEEEMIWAGVDLGDDHALTVTGIIESAQDAGGGADWGHATIATAVSNCKADLLLAVQALRKDMHYGPYYAVMTKDAEVALWQTVPDTGGALLREFAEKLFTLGVYGTDWLYPAVSGGAQKLLVGEPGPLNHGIILAQDMDTVILDDRWDYYGRVYEAVVSEVFRDNSCAYIDSITEID